MRSRNRLKLAAALSAAAWAMASASTAMAACRVTDFTDRTLRSLNDAERLSFISQMTQTEYDKLHAMTPDSASYDPAIVQGANVRDVRQAAIARLESLGIENIDYYRRLWASDFLTDDQLRRYTDCITSRQPGLAVTGRSESPTIFHLTFSHLTPIGIEKITTRLVASSNIANIKDFEAFLTALGARDNYPSQTFALHLEDPSKPAVLVMRAGWETPKFVYIPVYPTPNYFK